MIKKHSLLFDAIKDELLYKNWFIKMIKRESDKIGNNDLKSYIECLESCTEKGFSATMLSKCIILSLSSQELKDSNGLRYVFVNRVIQMFMNTLINFENKTNMRNLQFTKILSIVVWKSILMIESKELIKTRLIINKYKKISVVEGLEWSGDFNDDFRFQQIPYDFKQNIFCNHENIEIGDLLICCELYEYNSPFLIRNLKNDPSKKNNYIELFKQIYNETIIDVESYKKAVCLSEKSKMIKIEKIEKLIIENKEKLKEVILLGGNGCNKKILNIKASIKKDETRIENIKRLIIKKKKFIEILEKQGNCFYFMKKICFRTRFYEISELGITNSKELRYSIIYDNISKKDIDAEILKIRDTKYYNELLKFIGSLKNKEFYIKKFKNYEEEDVLVICLLIIISIGMEFKNEILSSNKKLDMFSFIWKGEMIIDKKIKDENYEEKSDDWEKEIYINKLISLIMKGEMSNNMVINKDYSASVFFNMVRLFSDSDEMRSFFNVGKCENWSCGYSFLIEKIKENIKKKNIEIDDELMVKKILKRAIMCQPYNVSSLSSKKYIIENIIDYEEKKEYYKEIIKTIVLELKDLKKNWLFKEQLDNLAEKVIKNDFNFTLSDMEICLKYYKTSDSKRLVSKSKEKRKTCSFYERKNEIDMRKTKIAMCANIMHSIDAFEMRWIYKNLNKKKGKNIHAIHDCVICTVFDFFKINDIANRELDYITHPIIKIKKINGYSLFIFS